MKKSMRHKLVLSKETLRTLHPAETAEAQGGFSSRCNTSGVTDSCDSCFASCENYTRIC